MMLRRRVPKASYRRVINRAHLQEINLTQASDDQIVNDRGLMVPKTFEID